MINPMVRSAAADLVAAQDEAIARYTAESASDMLEPEQRCASSKQAAHQRNLRDALSRVSEAPENYILVASQPLQSFPCLDARGATAQLSPRDDSDRDASRRRSSLGWAFARESAIATAIVRKECQYRLTPVRPCWWHNASSARRPRLLRASPAPPAPSPTLPSLSPRRWLRAASPRRWSKPSWTSLHVTCDQPWAYDAISNSNAGNTDQATYTTPHSLDTGATETWAGAFRTASGIAGTPVDAIVN